ncbi:glycosyl hydrolase family 39 [Acidipila rosea]|uniref:Glycosyl hydrolase family 39 n=1 Tax=Acidipila rosea TaxID=768535 RepID=A0A4R1LG14_9BACT|nr:glycosyl hydrolase family 39 [Acidipila rosea]TCK75793.1 glycosyl hydrolase family 39 [Acidipila rosea]
MQSTARDILRRLKYAGLLFAVIPAFAQAPSDVAVRVDWNHPLLTSKTTATLQVVVNPLLERASPIHDAVFANLKSLGADYVRYVPWLPYPKLAVAEMEPPTKTTTSWDFSRIDPMTTDFLDATAGHPVIVNFSTSPAWLYKTPKPVPYPANPDDVDWDYTQGTQLIDPSGKQLGDYYARLVDWYTNGGFIDENGKRHDSGHHYPIAYWEVGNEVDSEHQTTAEDYTQHYDAIVAAIHKDNPKMKFVGLALADPSSHPEMFEYFLNPANHKPGIPLDMISYHFYATPSAGQTVSDWQYTFFDQAERFLSTVRYIESIRKRLSPETRTTLDEIGSILPGDPGTPGKAEKPISPYYWQLSGALYADVYLETVKLGIDVVGESQLVGYPSQFPSVTLLDWTTGAPNARFAVLQLIKSNFSAGDTVVDVKQDSSAIAALGFVHDGRRKLLLVNKRNRSMRLELPPEFSHGEVSGVQSSRNGATVQTYRASSTRLMLDPFAVIVVAQ